jgi:hypothetical protein
MRQGQPNKAEIADYVASLLNELAALSKPLQDTKLTSAIAIAADLARNHDTMKQSETEIVSQSVLWDRILPARHKAHPRTLPKPNRAGRAVR